MIHGECEYCGSKAYAVGPRAFIRYRCGSIKFTPAVDQEFKQSATCMERERMVQYLNDYGIPEPITDCKGIPCEHDVYLWNTCETCAIEQLIEVIRGGAS